MQVAVRLSALGPSTPSSLLSPKYELGESFPLLFLGACLCQIGGVGRLPPLKGRPAHGSSPSASSASRSFLPVRRAHVRIGMVQVPGRSRSPPTPESALKMGRASFASH
jgi:hypothetical protein